MIAPVTHMLALTNLRRARMLPVNGRVLVRAGQKLNATDVIGEANLNNPRILVDVRKSLGLSGSTQLGAILQRKTGEKVETGDILAATSGLFKRVLHAPVSGQIVSITSSGQILIESTGPVFQMRAGLPGTVMEVIADRGVIVESTGALLQGVWGNGRTDQGLLLALAHAPEEVLTRDRFDVSMRGAVVVAGHCAQADAIKMANELPLRGLILGSATADLLPVMQSCVFPVILLEGFGRIPMNTAAFRILTTNEKRDIALHATPWNAFTGERPEVLIPLGAAAQVPPESDTLKIGQTVRITGMPYAGMIGTLTGLSSSYTRLPNGVRAVTATIKLENNTQVSLPLANLDVLE